MSQVLFVSADLKSVKLDFFPIPFGNPTYGTLRSIARGSCVYKLNYQFCQSCTSFLCGIRPAFVPIRIAIYVFFFIYILSFIVCRTQNGVKPHSELIQLYPRFTNSVKKEIFMKLIRFVYTVGVTIVPLRLAARAWPNAFLQQKKPRTWDFLVDSISTY